MDCHVSTTVLVIVTVMSVVQGSEAGTTSVIVSVNASAVEDVSTEMKDHGKVSLVLLGYTTVSVTSDAKVNVAASVAAEVQGGRPSSLEATSVEGLSGRSHVQDDMCVEVLVHDVELDGSDKVNVSTEGEGVLYIVMHEVIIGDGVTGATLDSPLLLSTVSIWSEEEEGHPTKVQSQVSDTAERRLWSAKPLHM